ncbi:MAG: PilZ domain-containing protein [Steroidobacteraceae bacterium]
MSLLNGLKRVVQKLTEVQPRAERRTASGLAASYGLDPASTHAGIKNISASGIYLVTEKRLRTGELITLKLEEGGQPENSSELQISLHARVARQGEDGIGLSFVLPPGLDTNLWEVLVRNIVALTDQDQIAHMFRTLRTVLFLCRICQSGAEDAIILLGGQLDSGHTETVVKIALGAEKQLASEPDADRMRAHPKLVASILKEGSWSLDEAAMQLWMGLLVSSCTVDEPDDSNQMFVNLLIHMTPNQAKIFIRGCERALASEPGGENSSSASIVLNSKEIVALTGQHDLSRNAADVANLFYLGMLQKLFDFTSYRDIENFDITPSSLGIELFKHCHGDRGKIEPHLVEAASTHLLNFIPPTQRQFNISVDEMKDSTKPHDAPYYQIAIAPSELTTGAKATKQYFSREDFIADLQQRLGYADQAIERFFAYSERHGTLMNHPLSEEDALYFGWH